MSGGGMIGGVSRQEVALMIYELAHNIMPRFDKLEKDLKEHKEMNRKMILLLSQLFKDGESNKDTLNKLDQFLNAYYENPYED